MMNKYENIKNKSKIAFSLLFVFAVIFLNYFSNWKNSLEFKNAIQSIYKDRLIAESYILELSENLHKIVEFNNEKNEVVNLKKIKNIEVKVKLFNKTKLTFFEQKKLKQFEKNIQKIKHSIKHNNYEEIKFHVLDTFLLLNELSSIQLSEAKILLDQTEKTFNSNKTSADLQIGIMIVLLIIIQILIFSENKVIKIKQSEYLN
ncbi:MAG: hypothetical protein HYU67_05045 [Flavobacteriia bacterium]|nr:hypothetical protein [Flavobacteriia bacterium]